MIELDVHIDDGDNVLASCRNVVVQVRTGRMTRAALTHIESVLRLTRARQRAEAVGMVAIIEETAEPPEAEVRARQAEVIKSLLSSPNSYSCAVMLGTSTRSMVLRSVIRMLVLAHRRFHIARDEQSAAAWLAERVGTFDADELMTLIAQARAIARKRNSGDRPAPID